MLVSFTIQAQTVVLDSTGKLITVASTKNDTTKVPDAVYAVYEGTTYYVSANGAVYCWRTSKKSGKMYKKYIKQQY